MMAQLVGPLRYWLSRTSGDAVKDALLFRDTPNDCIINGKYVTIQKQQRLELFKLQARKMWVRISLQPQRLHQRITLLHTIRLRRTGRARLTTRQETQLVIT